ncbi:hypothetical protein [Nocardia sp. CC227C]|uniref:hypothetical protein n=1 Tax=Nocardia sp. CC227C TaxID=3044562 RepID=UPI00278BC69C|nr:hypothetical protein [Nocardia sp. CC227C]
MRRRLAGALIRLAHRIYRPTVTETTFNVRGMDSEAAAAAVRRVMERRESRGWN